MKTEKINYKFIPVPLRLTLILDEKCTKVLTHLIQLHFAFANENDLFYRSIDLLSEETQLSKRVLNAVLVTLNNLYIVDVYSVGQSKGKKTNQFRINFNVIETYDSIEFETILKINKIKTLGYTNKSFKVEYHNVQNLITKSDNDSDNNLQNLITKSVLEQKLKEYSQNLITKSAKINHNINNTIIDNTYKNNIGPNIGPNNNIIYISEQVEGKEKSNSKVNCFLSKEEIEEYNSVNSSEAESNPIAESETVNNRDNSNIDNNISTVNSDNNTANAESGSKESVISNSVNSENNLDNLNSVIPNYKLDNSNEVNTAVLSPSNVELEESVISTKKTSEKGLKQAKTKELEIINKTDNSNNVKPKEEKVETNNLDNSKNVNSNTANAVTEETVYSNIDNSKEVEGNNNRDNFNYVNSDNRTDNSNSVKSNSTANAVTEEVEIINSVKPVMEEIESNNSVNSNSVKPVIEEGIEGENKTDNSNERIDNTIAFGDNPTAYAVSEFRDKCTKYTIIIEGKETEIDQPIEEYIRCYYNRIMNTIYNTNDLNKKRKIFNKILNENKLFGEQYDEMSDNLDIRYSRYLELDKQANKQTEKEEFSNEEVQYIANELLNQCLEFKLTNENNIQDFYNLRNNYNAFTEEYNVPKEGLKLQEKFAELSVVNKKLNTPVSSQSFAV